MKKSVVVAALVAVVALPVSTADAKKLSCGLFGNLKSVDSRMNITLRIQNRSGEQRTLLWLDYNGQPKHYKDLAPGESYTQQTLVGHPWMATDGPGNCKGIFVPSKSGRWRLQ